MRRCLAFLPGGSAAAHVAAAAAAVVLVVAAAAVAAESGPAVVGCGCGEAGYDRGYRYGS